MKRKSTFIDRTGEKLINNQGCEMIIIVYRNSSSVDIRFENGYIAKNQTYQNFKKGYIKNVYHPLVYGVGYKGEGIYSFEEHSIFYKMWNSMICRCYSIKKQQKYPIYISCSVDERWHNFQTFAEWATKNYIENYQLDKDILIKGNKIYSPETCRFVHRKINSLFTGCYKTRGVLPIGVRIKNNKYEACVNIEGKNKYLGLFNTTEEAFQAYKIAKEKHIKETAIFCKNILSEDVYQALLNYEVEITD